MVYEADVLPVNLRATSICCRINNYKGMEIIAEIELIIMLLWENRDGVIDDACSQTAWLRCNYTNIPIIPGAYQFLHIMS